MIDGSRHRSEDIKSSVLHIGPFYEAGSVASVSVITLAGVTP